MNNNSALTPSKKLSLGLIVLFAIIVGGSIGFSILENMRPLDALYMTVITLSTVGFGEVSPLSPAGRAFVMILIIVGVMTATFTASTIGQIVLEGQLRSLLGRKKMDNKIKKLSSHNIIAGFGRVGRQVAEEYARRKVPFVVIEKNPEALNYLQSTGYNYVEGEATEDDILYGVGIDRAKVLVSTLPSEADNVYLYSYCQTYESGTIHYRPGRQSRR
jgi:voltage-gated potassium channel